MRLYLAGPMRGIEDENYPAFEETSRRLRRAGYEVTSPHELGRQSEQPSVQHYGMLIRSGIQQMLSCHAVALLPGWEASQGAQLEIDVAHGAGMTVADATVWLEKGLQPLKWRGDVAVPTDVLRPQRQYEGDAGFDLVCSDDVQIGYQEFRDVPCGISVELPPGVWALIIGRSSTLRKRQLMVAPGIIDNGWRGGLFAGVWNMGKKPTAVRMGERIAQLIPFPLVAANLELEQVRELSESDRGSKGFGSTGT